MPNFVTDFNHHASRRHTPNAPRLQLSQTSYVIATISTGFTEFYKAVGRQIAENYVVDITAGLFATIVGASLRFGYAGILLDKVRYFLSPSGWREVNLLANRVTPLQQRIVRLLLRDQSRSGFHKGEYGRSSDPERARTWQDRKSAEKLDLKPRMYLTYWPAFILHQRRLAPQSVRRAKLAVEGHYVDNKIPLASSRPSFVPTIRLSIKRNWNYRHTMEGADLLVRLDATNQITPAVMDQMLDSHNGWQAPSGGWWHTNEGSDKPDLWTTVYAAKLLGSIDQTCPQLARTNQPLVQCALRRTLKYLEDEWTNSQWRIENQVSSEENVVLMYIDLAETLQAHAPTLKMACESLILSWLSPSGYLTESYLAAVKAQPVPLSPQQAYSRMAYALYLSDRHAPRWVRHFERAVDIGIQRDIYSNEWAFLLDLTFEYIRPR